MPIFALADWEASIVASTVYCGSVSAANGSSNDGPTACSPGTRSILFLASPPPPQGRHLFRLGDAPLSKAIYRLNLLAPDKGCLIYHYRLVISLFASFYMLYGRHSFCVETKKR